MTAPKFAIPCFCVMLCLGQSVQSEMRDSQDAYVVRPGITTHIPMSQKDLNWLKCEGPITDVLTSSEKNVDVKYSGMNAFVKFKALQKADETLYSEIQTEFYVVCDGAVYKILAEPTPKAATTVLLSAPVSDIRDKQRERFRSMPWEQTVMTLISEAYHGDIPETYEPETLDQDIPFSVAGNLTLRTRYHVPGAGLNVYIYDFQAKDKPLENIEERNFLRSSLQTEGKTVAVALEHHRLSPHERTRVFLVSRPPDNQSEATPTAMLRELTQ